MTISVHLSDEEANFMRCGLRMWGGPVSADDRMAVAIGFSNAEEMRTEIERIASLVRSDESTCLTVDDWRRGLFAAELPFATLECSALDWASVTGIPDEEAIKSLRSLQRKVLRATASARRDRRLATKGS